MIGLINQVAGKVGVTSASCRHIASTAFKRYKIYYIPKKNGRDVRLVAQPAREVKAIQRAIIDTVDQFLPVHRRAVAYKKGSSIITNALCHVDARFLTKLDFCDFFPSIGGPTLERHLRKYLPNGISDAEIKFIIDACTWRPTGRPVLCIGAPSSPLLSNTVMFEFDRDCDALCEKLDVVYTRYSDDIALSSQKPDVLRAAEDLVRARCRESQHPVIRVNEGKRVAVGRASAMRVTGLTLANERKVTVGRERKRGVRAGIRHYLLGHLDEEAAAQLKGEIAFVLSVEPDYRAVILRVYGFKAWPLLPRLRDAEA